MCCLLLDLKKTIHSSTMLRCLLDTLHEDVRRVEGFYNDAANVQYMRI